ncbi:ZDHHC17 [Cervus elaphus hippelaphus]|uniref:ZDHHC17 n=1 Tax=Cervus elaphus hippelaphus TaxID=46360 RepID=A0A212DF83_CEREH|nr:ZDHHC17 [Cervus elaphus hippelaphus]
MQREEGFNTKMADGPDEYESEAGCVPLLHPEVRNGTERSPRPRSPRPFAPGTRGWAVACVCGAVERAGVGEGGQADPGPSGL